MDLDIDEVMFEAEEMEEKKEEGEEVGETVQIDDLKESEVN